MHEIMDEWLVMGGCAKIMAGCRWFRVVAAKLWLVVDGRMI